MIHLAHHKRSLLLPKRAYRIGSLLLIFLCIFSCNKHKEVHSDEKTKDKIEAFFRKLPFGNPDSAISLIEQARITQKKELAFLHERIIDTLNFASMAKYKFAYIAYLEQKMDTLNPKLTGGLYAIKGKAYYDIGKTDSCFLLMNKGIKLLEQSNDSILICRAYNNICKLYLLQGSPLIGTERTLVGLKYIPKLIHDPKYPENNQLLKNELKNTLLSFYAQRDIKKAKLLAMELLKESAEENSANLYKVLAYAFYQSNQPDSALWAAEKQTHIFHTYKETQTAFGTYNLGVSWRAAKQPAKAIPYLSLGKHIADSLNIKTASEFCAFQLGSIYLQLGDFEKAESYYNELQNDKLVAENLTLAKMLADSLMVLNIKKGKIQEGLEWLQKSKKLADTLKNKENKFLWADMNVRYETSEKESKIKHLLLEKRNLQIQGLAITAFLLFLLSCIIWIFYNYHQKQALLAKENALLESDRALLEIRNQLQEQEINMSKQQLSDFQENMMAKNALIDEMQLQMNALIANTTSIAESEIYESRAKLNELKILTEKDWRIYLEHFEKAYPNYIKKVEQHFPNLTKAEFRLFLILYLGLSNEEIATFLGISQDSTYKSQYRLKKKLKLNEEGNLREFIKKF